MKLAIAILTLVALCGCLRPPADAVAGPALYFVSLPRVVLQGGELLTGLKVDLVGARIRAVNTVPEDWSVEIKPAVSGQWVLTMSANHSTAWLRNVYGLERFLTVAADDDRLIGISATVKANTANGEREIVIGPGDVVLEPLSRQ
jgi:hypothetical protein